MFSLRIVTTSHYQAKPIPGLDTTHSEFRNLAIKRVPVLRIFGSTPAGQKTCMHIHGVFPYLYVPYDGTQPVDRYLRQFASSLDKALNIATRSTNNSFQHVYKISLVSGIPMYGHHPQEEHFLKIYLFNPSNVRKTADLLLGGAVMNKSFQPYESHLPYILQLFIDHNLYGMNLINVAALKFRKKVIDGKSLNKGSKNKIEPSQKSTATLDESLLGESSSVSLPSLTSSPVDHIWNEENISSELWLPDNIERQSTCELEVDVVAADITNIHELASNIGANPGLVALREDEKQRRRDAGESSLLEPDFSQARVGVLASDSERELVERFLDIVRLQQAFRSSQSQDSLLSQPSQTASQLENHLSGADSISSSQNTVILGDSDDEDEGGQAEEDSEHAPIVSINSIERVVSCSQSFTSQKDVPNTKDQSVADILAALLEESGPPPSQLATLEDQDSILNQSVVLDAEAEKDEEEESLLMSQVTKTNNQETDVDFDVAAAEDTWEADKAIDVVMTTDDDDNDSDASDEVDLLPQLDGTSDKIPVSQNKLDQSQMPIASQNTGTIQGDTSQNQSCDPNTVSRSDVSWRAGTPGRVIGSSQGFPSGSGPWTTQQGWPQQSGPGGSSWHGQSPTWSQQQQYHCWPQHQQMASSTFPPQQTPFGSPSSSSSTSFQSSPHNPYTSPTHQQVYQTPSPTAAHPQYQYPSYQSPSSSQTYQQSHQSPSQHPYQPLGSNQTFQSPQSYQSSPSSQPYQSPSRSQPYSPLGATSQTYQLPSSSKYVSPSGNQPYQSPQATSGYQSTSSQMFSSPYHSPSQSHHSPPLQPYPPPYQSPVQGSRYQPQTPWNPQNYPGYYQGHAGSAMKHSGSSSQPDASFMPPGSMSPNTANRFLSQDSHHTSSYRGLEEPNIQAGDGSLPRKKKGGRKKKDSTKSGLKSPQVPCLNPSTNIVSKNPFEVAQQNSLSNSSQTSTTGTSSFVSGTCLPQSQDGNAGPSVGEENKSAPISGSNSSDSLSITKTSALEFNTNTSTNIVSSSVCTSQEQLTNDTSTPTTIEKIETNTATPMIQQLLMEEPVRMNIRKEDREAVMKKPTTSTPLLKPKRKYTRKTDQGVRKPGRPRSMSISSPASTSVGYCGYPQPMMNMSEKSHTVSPHPFSCQPWMPSAHNYSGQQHFLPKNSWQQQQQQPTWGMNEWQGYNSPGNSRGTGGMGSNSELMTSRLQQRSLSADTAQSQKTFHPDQISSGTDNHIALQDNSGGVDEMIVDREGIIDKSSLSSLLQLVSDVGSEDIDWESGSSTVVPHLFPNSIQPEIMNSMPTSDVIQESPAATNFITLETPIKDGFEKTNSDLSGMTSSEESDRTDLDVTSELKPRTLSACHGSGSSHPRLGKHTRLKKPGQLCIQSTDLCSFNELVEPNPAYTYTFHVPTPVFKKLKFMRSIESRQKDFMVVRMHPMDARRYSLLKIGSEIVKVIKLTESELSKYNVSLRSPYHFVSADGSTNRVNLDIPVVSVDRRSGDSGSEESSLSKFDTDFPPNKVAPPSTFDASQVSASLNRTTSAVPRGSPMRSDWLRMYAGQQPTNFSGRFCPRPQHETFSPHQQHSNFPFAQQQRDGSCKTSGHQQIPQCSKSRHFGSQPPESSSGLAAQHFSQRDNNIYPHSAPSSSHSQGNYYDNQPHMYQNHTPYPQQQAFYQQQQQQYQIHQQFNQHQPQTSYSGSYPEPKNGLRSPSQHGLISKIDNGKVCNHSGDQETELTTQTSPFNTRVNAQNSRNHAGHMANAEKPQAELCTKLHSPDCEQLQSMNCCISKDDSNFFDEQMNHSLVDKEDNLKRRTKHLSLKQSENIRFSSTHDVDSASHTTKNNSHSPAVKVIVQLNQKHCAKFRHNVNNNSDPEKQGQKRGRSSWRKNVKALRLRIPMPKPDHHSLNDSSDYTEECPILNSQKLSDEGENITDSRDISQSGRSTRSTSQEDEVKSGPQGKQSPRQAKLRSFYSKNPFSPKPKKKRRKKQGSLIEGVHYIVVGKFRGYQTMLVKIKKLNLSPADRVRADLFEKRAAKEKVREVSPVFCLKDGIYSCNSEILDYQKSITEELSDEALQGQLEPGNCEIAHHVATTTFQGTSRGKPRRYGKYRSAHAASSYYMETLEKPKLDLLDKEMVSKNVLTGPIGGRIHGHPTSGAREINTHCSYLVGDSFFDKFKEIFIRHTKAKEQVIENETEGHENTIFEGVQASNFKNFQLKFLANIQKLKSHGYSSSSDDEEDVLDEIVWTEKFGVPLHWLTHKITKDAHNSVDTGFTLGNGRAGTLSQLSTAKSDFQDIGSKISKNLGENYLLKNVRGSNLSPDYDDFCSTDKIGKSGKSPEIVNGHLKSLSSDAKTCSEVSEQHQSKVDSFQETQEEETNIEPNESCNKPTCSEINLDSKNDLEEKEDYLKSQMAFFEDITSDSDSYDTIIMDSSGGKENVSQTRSSPLPFSVYESDKLCVSLATMAGNSHPELVIARSENPHVSENALSNNAYPVLKKSQAFEDSIRLTEKSNSVLKTADSFKDGSPNHGQPQTIINKDNEKFVPETLVSSLSPISPSPDVELSVPAGNNAVNVTDKLKTVLDESDDATIELDMGVMEPSKNSSQNNAEQLDTSKAEAPGESGLLKSIDSGNDREISLSREKMSRHKRHGKNMKKSKRDKGSRLVNRRKLLDDINSSSNDEANNISEDFTFSPNKCLRQRRQTLYTELFDSTEDDSEYSSDDDFNCPVSKRNISKNNRKLKDTGLKDKQIKKQVKLDLGKVSKSSRGKKKKTSGGDKLLNSLSLLHMATLANLTENQPETAHVQPVSVVALQADEHEQYSDRVNNDHNTSFTPTLEHLSFISPPNSGELVLTPPDTCSPTDKKRWKHSQGGTYRGEDIVMPRRLFNSHRFNTLKPGCNGAPNLGTKPLPSGRLMNNSTSPVPSNFSFNYVSESSLQPESSHQNEDVGASNTLQLLETRRAQVNCASFSMKDILRLTTTDDSMDSDSKDSAALVRPPEPKRAQVKSTALSMDDILKLTGADKNAEIEHTPTSHSIISLMSYQDPSITQLPNSNQEVTSISLHEKCSASDIVPQNENLMKSSHCTEKECTKLTDSLLEQSPAKRSSPIPDETSEASHSLLSQLANFSEPNITVNPEKCHKTLSQKEVNVSTCSVTRCDRNDNKSQENPKARCTLSGKGFMEANSKTDKCTDNTDENISEKAESFSNQTRKSTVVEITNSKGPDYLQQTLHDINIKVAHDISGPDSSGGKSAFEEKSPSPAIKMSVMTKETSVLQPVSNKNLHLLVLNAQSACHNKHQQAKANYPQKELNKTDNLPSTTTTITKDLSASPIVGFNKSNSDRGDVFTQIPQAAKICQVSASSVLEIPRISVTFDGTSISEYSKPTTRAEHINIKATERAKEELQICVDRELKPLHPLQIPPYPFIGHSFGPHSGQTHANQLNPSVYYPYCWQWPFHTPGSDPSGSPLNLCVIQKSPTSYSPITPTSPISPDYSSGIQAVTNSYISPQTKGVTGTGMSPPPLKKAKPLWYPWLTVEPAMNKSVAKVKVDSLKGYKSINQQNKAEDQASAIVPKPSYGSLININHTTMPAISKIILEDQQKNDSKTFSGAQESKADKILDGCCHSPNKSNFVGINSDHLPNSQTVPQFLGTVTASEFKQGNKDIARDPIGCATDTSLNLCSRTIVHEKQKTGNGLRETCCSYGSEQSVSQSQHRPCFSEAHGKDHFNGQDEKIIHGGLLFESEPDRMEGDEKKLTVNFSLSSPGNYFSPAHANVLSERLITKLIKGDSLKYLSQEPVDTSGGKKQAGSCQMRNRNMQNQNNSSNKHSSGQSKGENTNSNDGNNDGTNINTGVDKEPRCKGPKDLIVRPVKSPPSRIAVEESLHDLGLSSVQPPTAFCSSLEDLPERPMEHGGRVLKVESKRLCELSPFTTSQYILGIKHLRSKSLSSSKLLSSQAGERSLWERLEQEPQLRYLLTDQHLVVVSPVRAPPSRTNVNKWLQNKMMELRKTKSLFSAKASKNSVTESNRIDKEQEGKNNIGLNLTSYVPELGSENICQQIKEEENTDYSMTENVASSQASVYEGDSSSFVDTDLDISRTPTSTPTLQFLSQKSFTMSLSKPLSTVPEEPHPACQTHHRKRKLFTDDAEGSILEVTSLADSHSLEKNMNTRKCGADVNTDRIKKKVLRLSSTASSSTPMKHSHDLPCTPGSLPQVPVAIESQASGNVQGIPDHPLLRHVSTNTENFLKKSVLMSQTQRHISDMRSDKSQIEGPTPKNSFGFKVMQTHMQDSKALHKYQYVTILSLELHIATRGDLRPDPEFDAVQAVFYSVYNDTPPEKGKRSITGVIVMTLDSWNNVTENLKNSKAGTSQTDPSMFASVRTSLKQSSNLVSSGSSSTAQPTTSSSTQAAKSIPTISTQSQASRLEPSSGGMDKANQSSLRSSPVVELLEKCATEGLEVTFVKDEMDLINTFTGIVTRYDPDILVGFEIQMLSWGYLLQRAAHLNVDLCSKISRVQDAKNDNRFSADKDEWGADHMSEIHVAGRIVLNLWRVLRHEITLNVYSFENVAYHVLHQRIPLYSFRCLSKWYAHKTHLHRWRVFEHYLFRVKGQLEVIDQLDLIGKTSEFARVFGIEFYDVLARGSQIRVESMMLRLAKPMNFVPVSPSVNQRAHQRAGECIQLNLEPESKYYTSPVAVLDFQSLYPSIMIAYNYCFTTCLGRLDFLEKAHDGPIEFGCTSLNLTPATLQKIRDHVTVSPNGVAFVKSSVRRGILPIMVEEILSTRLMVKKSMKSYKEDKILTRMLDARQLGLKLIANVTYGYTNANFSGRMPCIEVADSIVRKARECLERAIELVRSTPKWGGHVVYGDTDSMFIHFPGRSKDEAFVLGQEIANAVTAMFPSPVKLRFEKIYMPCVLQTKKRYVGFMYETPDQKEPVYDAKGIETVRRDACSAVSKVLERSIKILFSSHDLSRVRSYVTRQMLKLLEGKVSIIDLIFAKEYRGMMGYKPGACVPALEIARRRLRLDRRAEPRVGERVPYVIVHGSPGLPLIQLVKEPSDLVVDTSLRLNAVYYITKQVLPPLDRIFSLIGVNVFKWYLDMPKVVRVGPVMGAAPANRQGTISQFFATTNCPVCDAPTKRSVCDQCSRDPQLVVYMLTARARDWERTYCRLVQVCDACQGIQDSEQVCVSIDCPIMFRRTIARQDLTRADNLQDLLNKYLSF